MASNRTNFFSNLRAAGNLSYFFFFRKGIRTFRSGGFHLGSSSLPPNFESWEEKNANPGRLKEGQFDSKCVIKKQVTISLVSRN